MTLNIKKEQRQKCTICRDFREQDEFGIECTQGHFIHGGDCIQGYIESCFEIFRKKHDPKIRCPDCKQPYVIERLLILLTPEQCDQLFSLSLKIFSAAILNPDEELVICSFCNFFGYICPKNNRLLFLRCKYDKCQIYTRSACTICHKPCDKVDEGREEISPEEECKVNFSLNVDSSSRQWHARCYKLRKIKKEFDDTLREGITNACPCCKFRGQKNEACTHMTCPNCDGYWCYVCEKKIEKRDSHPCPMYLSDLKNTDPTWPINNEEAVTEYHKEKTLCKLQKKVAEKEKTSPGELKNLLKHFPTILGGFNIWEIKYFVMKDFLKKWLDPVE